MDLHIVQVEENPTNPTRMTVEGVASSRFAMSAMEMRGDSQMRGNSRVESAIQNSMIPQLQLGNLA